LGEAVRLCRILQGVEFTVIEQDTCIRGLIPRETLEAVFGADETPESWLHAYERNADRIDCAAADLYRSQPTPGVVVLSEEQWLHAQRTLRRSVLT